MKNSSIILKPLHELTSLKNDFIWKKSHNEAFEKVKNELSGTTGVYHPNPNYELILCTDASGLQWVLFTSIK